MKKVLFILSFSILFQSCFSYKSVDYNNIAIDKKQKIKVEMLDKTNFKGQLVSKDETKMILEKNRSTLTILKEEIYEVKVVKFSILKSSGIVAVVAVLIAILAPSIIAGANSGG